MLRDFEQRFIPAADEKHEQDQAEFSLLHSSEYGQYLLKSIEMATKRVWLQSMNIENDHLVGVIFHKLEEASLRGVDVRLNIDYFNNMVTDGNLDVLPALFRAEREYRLFRKLTKAGLLTKLEQAQVKVTITNLSANRLRHFFPPVGRNHIKLAVIDDRGLLGGINLSDKDFQREDCMVQTTNQTFMRSLERAFLSSTSYPRHQSAVLGRVKKDEILFDGNYGSSSVILDKVEEMVSTAEQSITICTQFAPDSFLHHLLRRAEKKNLSYQLIVSDPSHITERNAWIFDRFDRIKARLGGIKMTLFPGWLHTKLVAVDIEGRKKKAIFGTHNFVAKGSKWKNEELALYTEDPFLLSLLYKYLYQLRAKIQRNEKKLKA
jgi:phosphatidylserine/phosphatidylglycerophosphate/cardiolipin synthase-like enzyme